jgi:hypothetical protein
MKYENRVVIVAYCHVHYIARLRADVRGRRRTIGKGFNGLDSQRG